MATRYEFLRPARAALLDQLIAAGFAATTPVEMDGDPARGLPGTRCWVTCDPAQFDGVSTVVAAHDAGAHDAAALQDRAADDDDRTRLRAASLALMDDYTALVGTGALTAAQQRAMLARTDRALVSLVRYLGRRGL